MAKQRDYTLLDKICLSADQAVRAIFAKPKTTERVYPGNDVPENNLTSEERKHAAALMRINHAGEVCAQALYHGQGLVSQRHDVKEKMQKAAIEEGDHLAWCHTRLTELGSHASYLNPVWYAGSFAIGLTAGLIGDQWSLGFLAETENQVVKHLENHLQALPENDQRSHKILFQMKQDEAHHRDDAIDSGAAILPQGIKKIMRFVSKIMVKTAYFV
ncbi:MAG TPA: 2-polyprenyl-3-methyl-6-methoxy-1,4-benzoquinone monooxygenase [Gammaproteobacteria bacterium]|nr:2-polyprenyl-3-methyl-6-methoxy-1,4-benzoquinone monooxygenase [Gammaproteobacteria bacterium]